MTKNLRSLVGATVGAVAALGFTSCAYDPYYGSPSVGASYSTGSGYGSAGYSSGGYGHGYGYGGSGFSTSVFIGTGDPGWGYDPTCYSYYDYRSRRYYDPYSYGYYPIGYRPPVVYGVPHPYGWRPGGGYIRPPSRVTNVTIKNYHDRESRYRSSSYGWAKQVRSAPQAGRREKDTHPAQNNYDRRSSQNSDASPNRSSRTSSNYSRDDRSRYQDRQTVRGSTRTDSRTQSNDRLPSRYNTPVASPQEQARQGQRASRSDNNSQRQQAQRNPQKGDRTKKEKQSDDEMKRDRNYR